LFSKSDCIVLYCIVLYLLAHTDSFHEEALSAGESLGVWMRN